MSARAGNVRGQWALDPDLDFLNHGSFGACPRPVLEELAEWQRRIERDPIAFVLHELEPALDRARREVAEFVGCEPPDLVFVTNPTTGVGAVLASLKLAPGDEILITNHTYNACRNAAVSWAERAGARVVVADVPFPVSDEGELIDAILRAVSKKTRLALLDHVTSPTALILPVKELVPALRARGVETLIDGAHAPGMLPLDIATLDADYYVGTLHKWCCAPKGASFLHVQRELQGRVHPLVVSHGYNNPRTDRSRYWLEFDWVGTYDPSPILCAPSALRYLGGLLPGGWPALLERNRKLARDARALLADRLGLSLPCPERLLGSMAALVLPDEPTPALRAGWPFAEPLYSRLCARHFQVPVTWWPAPPHRLLRISAQIYNDLEQYERLARAVEAELA